MECDNEPAEIYVAQKLVDFEARYKKRGVPRECIAKMLGISNNRLRKNLEDARDLLKKNNIEN